MPYNYSSIFDGPKIITKKDLCEILNLDTSRPNLLFSPQEIKAAYKKRAIRFHPDKQSQFDKPIPEKICNMLMNDITKARDHLLNGDDNIPGKAFQDANNFVTGDFADIAISTLNALKNGTSNLPELVGWLHLFSSEWLMMIFLSTYSDNQLNFRYINILSEPLSAIRPYLKNIDSSSVIHLLRQMKEGLQSTDETNIDKAISELIDLFPNLISDEKKRSDLILAIKESSKELKNTLTDEFINQIEYILKFWPNLIATIPSWKHIAKVYFISLLFTATSLPKFFNAVKVISEIIIQQKGILPFVALALPLLLTTAIILPINIALQLSIQLAWLALKAAIQMIANGLQIVFASVNLLNLLFSESNKSYTHDLFSLFEGNFNLFIRLTTNSVLETLNAVIFILSNYSPLTDTITEINEIFDKMLNSIRPEKELSQNNESNLEKALVVWENKDEPQNKPQVEFQDSTQNLGFFANAPLSNTKDVWLDSLLENIHPKEMQEQTVTP